MLQQYLWALNKSHRSYMIVICTNTYNSSYYGSSHSRVCCCTTIGYWVGQPAKRWQMLFVFDLLLLVGNAVHCTQSLRWLLIWSYEPRTGRSTTTAVITPAVTNVLFTFLTQRLPLTSVTSKRVKLILSKIISNQNVYCMIWLRCPHGTNMTTAFSWQGWF